MSLGPLGTELSALLEHFQTFPPSIVDPITTARLEFNASFDLGSAIKVGATLPEFTLPDALGKEVSSSDLLAQGPILISFYRGLWCPFCSLELRALQKHVEEFKALGVTLIAISPELPDTSLTTTEKLNLSFTVLSDVGNKYAEKLGILFRQPDVMRPVFKKLNHDLKAGNGDDSFVVPVPATLLVDKKGVVRNAYIEPDYTERLEPSTALQWIREL